VALREMLLDPLGMTSTSFYAPADKQATFAETLDTDALKKPLLSGIRVPFDATDKAMLKGGAGLVGTAEDYLKFCQMIANGGVYRGKRYLSRKTVEFMLSEHTTGMGGTTIASTGPGYGFGLGFAVRQGDGMGWTPGSKGDAMWAGAWGTSFWIDPKEQIVGIMMAQAPSHRVPLRMLFKNLAYGALVQ
jgi:CubicO group peptidase (beta-lactamase class C family)